MSFIQVINGSVPASDNGVFIPFSAVKGLDVSEVDPSNTGISEAVRQSKCLYAVLDRIAEYVLDPASKVLGLTATKGNLTGASASTFNVPYSFSSSNLLYVVDGSLRDIPVPTVGASSGVGKVLLTTLFASANYLAVGDSNQSSGIFFPENEINQFFDKGSRNGFDPVTDCRSWLFGILEAASQYPGLTRATGVQSAFTVRTVATAGAAAIPAAMIAATNPTSGIAAADALKYALFNRSYNFTVQFALNAAAQTYDVAVV
jgi:hypothetical protein